MVISKASDEPRS